MITFEQIINSSVELNNQKKYIGYHCIFVPEEILHAAGFTPIRLFPTSRSNQYIENIFHTRSCEFVRRLAQDFLNDKFYFLKGMLFSSCCDALKALYDRLSEHGRMPVFHINNFKYTSCTKQDKSPDFQEEFFMLEYRKLTEKLCKYYRVEITDQALASTLSIYRQNRMLLKRLQEYYHLNKINKAEYYKIVQSGYCIRKEEHNIILNKILNYFKEESSPTSTCLSKDNKKTPIFLVGNINANHDHFIQYLNQLGIEVVEDDLCGFSRYFQPMDSGKYSMSNPYKVLYHENKVKWCPIKATTLHRVDNLVNKYHQSNAKGIIFTIFQYCDIQQVDYALLKIELTKRNIPSLLIRSQPLGSNTAPLDTRISAFLEMINIHD